MKRSIFFLHLSFFLPIMLWAQAPPENKNMKPEDTEVFSPVPEIVNAGGFVSMPPPSDAVILFDGHNLNQWTEAKAGGPALWTVHDGVVTVNPGTGSIQTKDEFEDFQLHIEWCTPHPAQNVQGKYLGNSGVFLQSLYEVQVLDSYIEDSKHIYVNGQAGSIYKQYAPLVNACRPPGKWQSYDIIFEAPRFNIDSTLKSPARVTVLQNGILIQNNVPLKGRTLFVGHPYYVKHGPMPLLLQDHKDLVSYRNIWIRRL